MNGAIKKARKIISLDVGPREYYINNVRYLVESRYVKADQGTANRTFADVIEDIIKSDYIDFPVGKNRNHN